MFKNRFNKDNQESKTSVVEDSTNDISTSETSEIEPNIPSSTKLTLTGDYLETYEEIKLYCMNRFMLSIPMNQGLQMTYSKLLDAQFYGDDISKVIGPDGHTYCEDLLGEFKLNQIQHNIYEALIITLFMNGIILSIYSVFTLITAFTLGASVDQALFWKAPINWVGYLLSIIFAVIAYSFLRQTLARLAFGVTVQERNNWQFLITAIVFIILAITINPLMLAAGLFISQINMWTSLLIGLLSLALAFAGHKLYLYYLLTIQNSVKVSVEEIVVTGSSKKHTSDSLLPSLYDLQIKPVELPNNDDVSSDKQETQND